MQAPLWTAATRPINDLVPYEKNPRKITQGQLEKLKKSIQEDGFHSPIIVDADMVIISGHQRVRALKELGHASVNIIFPDRKLSPEEFDRINLRGNLTNGEWDIVRLNEMFEVDFLKDMGLPLDLLGKIAGKKNEPATDPDETPTPPAEAVTAKGDVWGIGPHRLRCGDTTEGLTELCQGTAVNLLLTDPPYNVAYVGKTKDALTIQNDEMPDADFRAFLEAAMKSAAAVMAPGAAFYIFHADSEGYNFRGAVTAAELSLRQCLIWVKDSMVLGRQDYHWQHEPCLYGWKEGAAHTWASDRKQTTLLEFARPKRSEDHPTMKPVDMLSYLINNSTHPGQIVLDGFGGSGSTMVAAHMEGRVAYLQEMDAAYCDVVVERMVRLFPELASTLTRNGQPFVWALKGEAAPPPATPAQAA